VLKDTHKEKSVQDQQALQTSQVQAIMTPFSQHWRWFFDGPWIVLEPPCGFIAGETMQYIHQHAHTHTVEAVFRLTPNPGVYLRFRLHSPSPTKPQKGA
jgi:hypothetical protein